MIKTESRLEFSFLLEFENCFELRYSDFEFRGV